MAITQTLTTSFKLELLQAVHNFNSDVFKLAVYTSAANLGANTLVYTSSNEVTSAGYTAGGQVLTGTIVTAASGVAYVTFNNLTWSNVTFTARGALVYNSTKGNKSVAVYNFGTDQTAGALNVFNIAMPNDTADEALIRIS
jgi:hypothetical protein